MEIKYLSYKTSIYFVTSDYFYLKYVIFYIIIIILLYIGTKYLSYKIRIYLVR